MRQLVLFGLLFAVLLLVGELAIFGLLIGLIGIVLLFGVWFAHYQRTLPKVPIRKLTPSNDPPSTSANQALFAGGALQQQSLN